MGIVATEQLAAADKIEVVHFSYKSKAPAMLDLLSNRMQMMFTTGFIAPRVKDGRVRAIVTPLDEWDDVVLDVRTMTEAGFPYIAMRG